MNLSGPFQNSKRLLKLLPVCTEAFVGQKYKQKQKTIIMLLEQKGGENYFKWIGNDVTGIYYIDSETRYIRCISRKQTKLISELKLNIIDLNEY